jgi:hypothetical protein
MDRDNGYINKEEANMFKTSEKQLRIAQRIADRINEYDPQANAIVENKDGFIFVQASTSYKSWLIEVGIRGGLKDMYTKKTVSRISPEYSYKLWI